MKKAILVAAFLAVPTFAFATGKTPKPPTPTPTPPAPVNNYSPQNNFNPHNVNWQGQVQGQQQTATGGAGGHGGQGGAGGTGIGGTGYGGSAASSSTATGGRGGRASANNAGQSNNQTTVVNAQSYQRDRLQAPGLAASFSGVAGNPCEGAPFGVGATMPGFGGLFQIPRESERCNARADALLAVQLGASSNAGLAILAGNRVGEAIANNPVVYMPRPTKKYRTVKRRKGCGC